MSSTAEPLTRSNPSREASSARALRVDVRIIGIVVAALILRIGAFIFRGPSAMDWDGSNFIRTAQSLLAGHGYIGIRGTINIVHAPLYPLLIAALTVLTRNAEESALIISLVAGAIFPAIVYLVAKRAFNERTGIIAAIIVAVHPIMIWLSLQLLADQLAFALEFAGLAVLLRWLEQKRAIDLAAAGAFLGLAYLARPEAVLDLAIAGATLVALLWRSPQRTAGSLLWLCVPFVLLVAPYVAFLTNATGHLLFEGKSPVNYAIGVRIVDGMNYIEAADGIGPRGQEVGAELGDGFYVTHRNEPRPSVGDRLRFAVRVAPMHVGDIAKTLVSRHYGTPIFLLLAIVGVISGLRSPRAVACGIVFAGAVGKFIALATVAHFWERYATPFVPYMSIFGAAGVAVCVAAAARRWPVAARPAFQRGAVALVAVFALGLYAVTLRDIRADSDDSRPLAAAGRWIAANEPSARVIMAVTPLVAYYAGDAWNALPWATSAEAMRYVRNKRPDLVVLEPHEPDRPYLAAWRRTGIPGGADLLYQSPGDPTRAVQVYQLHEKSP